MRLSSAFLVSLPLVLSVALPARPARAAEGTPVALPYATGQATAGTGVAFPRTVTIVPSLNPPVHPEPEEDEGAPLPIPPFRDTPPVGPVLRAPKGPETMGPTRASARSFPGPLSAPEPLAPTDFAYFMDTPIVGGGSRSNRTPEPGLGTNDQLVFSTGNWYAQQSRDAGHTVSFISPYTAFPSANGGFCCDQVAIYEPSRDLMIWLLQYSNDAAGSTLRLAVAHGINNQTNLAWTYYDLTPQAIGYAAGNWYDFNDLGISNNNLYLTTNARTGGASDSFIAGLVYRFSLDELAAGLSIGYQYLAQTDAGAYHCASGVSTTMYFLSHPTLSSVRILRWAEGSGTLFQDDVSVTAFVNGGGSCPDPNGVNWCAFSDSRIGSAWRTPVGGGEIIAMWNAAQGGVFAYPHVQVATFRESDRALLGENYIYSSTFAFYYSSAGANNRGDAAGTIGYGGGGQYANGATWVWDDVNAHVIQPLEAYGAVAGSASPSIPRWGDFFNTRRHSRYSNSWNTVAFADTTANGSEPHFIWMGRNRDLPIYPANDDCASASVVSLVTGSTVTRFDDSSYAVFAVSDPAVCGPVSRTLWYRFTAPTRGTVTIDTSGSSVDTVVSIWNAVSCPAGAPLACDDDSGAGTASLISNFPVASGQTYYVMVGTYGGTNYAAKQYYGGPLQTGFSFRSCPTPPTVTSPPGTTVTQTLCN